MTKIDSDLLQLVQALQEDEFGIAQEKWSTNLHHLMPNCQEMTEAMKAVLAQLMIEDESLAELISTAIGLEPQSLALIRESCTSKMDFHVELP